MKLREPRIDPLPKAEWSDEQLATFEKAWNEVRVELASEDPFFRRVADSFYAWMVQHRVWSDATQINSTYLK